MARTVLVTDDEPGIRRVLREYLRAEGYRVLEAGTGAEALALLGLDGSGSRAEEIDLVLLDIGLPDLDGLNVLTRIRQHSEVYVMVITARAEEIDAVVGLSVGADDYVTKPFSVREVVARTKAVFRRLDAIGGSRTDLIRVGGLEVDARSREIRVDGRPVELSALDFDLLAVLAGSPGRVWSRGQLLDKVWGHDFYGDERVVDVHIRTVRRALGDDSATPRFIATIRGVGYKLLPASRDSA